MASAAVRDELLCSICLSLYTDPVTLRCGHNFCRGCIDQVLNIQDGSGVFSCPECRAEFRKRPALRRNVTLHNVAERVLSTQPHQEEITGIRCTYCIHSCIPAVKSCLMCEASLCANHLRVHSKSAEHVLTEPSTNLESRKCSVHKEVLKYYCTKDAICICVSCSLAGEHRGHQVEMLDEASEKKKSKLRNVLQKLFTKREKTKERVRSLEERRRNAEEKAHGGVERVTALFRDIRRQLDDLEKRVLSEIFRREMGETLSALIKMQIKKEMMSRKMRHIEELSNMTDPLTVLQEPDTGDLYDSEEEGGDEDTGGPDGGDEDTGKADGGVVFYVQGPADILLDINTAGNYLLISDDLKTASWTEISQNRPETAERFQYYQVMSRRRFSSGRHYWDVEIGRSEEWGMGICYPTIDRREHQSYLGYNNKSWCLYGGRVYNKQYAVGHDSKVIQFPHQISSNRFRICLDYEAGQLSFYELCDPIRHLHTFLASFTEPLHPVLCVWRGYIKILG
ncbi:E3 ubiquitin/ISG15 ligase TRIM25-like [Eleutherodactylus coqui]|uniref:E3 ubiquitin/ISG15 ligase TRIM25-like n=1 Tax=Eleutherodactylus coqui TaxID=57060 RepID=UPI0034624E35